MVCDQDGPAREGCRSARADGVVNVAEGVFGYQRLLFPEDSFSDEKQSMQTKGRHTVIRCARLLVIQLEAQ